MIHLSNFLPKEEVSNYGREHLEVVGEYVKTPGDVNAYSKTPNLERGSRVSEWYAKTPGGVEDSDSTED